jgi:hypothetical protein
LYIVRVTHLVTHGIVIISIIKFNIRFKIEC